MSAPSIRLWHLISPGYGGTNVQHLRQTYNNEVSTKQLPFQRRSTDAEPPGLQSRHSRPSQAAQPHHPGLTAAIIINLYASLTGWCGYPR
jgi:hypothetical protein